MRQRAFWIFIPLIAAAACSQTPKPAPASNTSPSGTAAQALHFGVVEMSIRQLQEAMSSGRVTSAELVEAYLERITAYDRSGPVLRTIIRLNPHAVAEAVALDEERKAKGPRGPLHGIPIVIKDNYNTQDMATTAGSISLAGARPTSDGFVVKKLRDAGAVLVGKTNMMEFALGITTLSSIGGQTKNPYDPTRYPGGSSGGSGAAVAASFAAVGWGTDTCGSIRVPSAYNSLFGLRSTKGITSVQGIVPLSHTQDVSGPLARTATDLAIALDATVGLDPADPASKQWVGRPVPRFVEALDSASLKGARFGAVTQFFGTGDNQDEVTKIVRAALARIAQAGGEVIEVPMPDLEQLSLAASVITFEFRDDLNRYLASVPTAPVRTLGDILARGLYLAELGDDYATLNTSPNTSSPGYTMAMAKRSLLERRLQEVLTAQRLDALVYPTTRRPPNLIGDPQIDPNCETSADSGLPALSVPVGFTDAGLPVGMELLGAPLSDPRLVALGYAWEQLVTARRPPPFTPHLLEGSAPELAPVHITVDDGPLNATMSFTFDLPTGRLGYDIAVTGIPADQLLAVSLHQTTSGNDGPVIAPLVPPGSLTFTSSVVLPVSARAALHRGQLYVTILTAKRPDGSLRAALKMPGAGPP